MSEAQVYGQINIQEFNQQPQTRAQTTEKYGRRKKKLTAVEFDQNKDTKGVYYS